MPTLHSKTTEALAACREALHALEAESHARRRHWSAQQAIPRHTASVTLRNVIAVMESERDPLPDDAESNATKRFLHEQMSECPCEVPRDCEFCCALETLLERAGYWPAKEVLPVSEGPVEGTTTVLDAPAALKLVAGALGDQGGRS